MRRLAVIPAGLLAGAVLAGCQMLDSQWVNGDPNAAGATCKSNAGAYHLPRRLITVTVTTGVPSASYGLNVDKSGQIVADRNETYCLDFLLSYLSADRVGIQRGPDGLLQRIYTQADDKTADIAKSVIQAAADVVSSEQAGTLGRSAARPQFSGQQDIIAKFEFDPFVEREAREVNEALIDFGFCVYLDVTKDVFAPRWSAEICRELIADVKPRGKVSKRTPGMVYKADPDYPRSGLPIFDPRPVPEHLQARGILYRPELTHTLVVLRKPDPKSRFSAWQPVASDRIVMPNAAPAFLLQVERAIFVKMETDVVFTNGMIKNISINKPSELLVASDIALYAAQVVVNIPKVAVQIFNNRAENTIELMKTNATLIETLRAHKADAGTLGAFGPAAATAASNNTRILGANPGQARLQACLAGEAAQQQADPMRFCTDLLQKGL